ncbi:MAG: NUDIX domain-containing protein [Parcubacteria group bacterium]|nr:NUDIX domain-containing protein [Parcubacteria group bacterium]
MPQEFSAGAIVFYRNTVGEIEYLLLHYKSGHWDFPKGHIEKGETEEETVRREIEEETGIKDLILIPGFKESLKYFFRQYKDKIKKEKAKPKKTPWVFKMVKFYLAESRIKEVKISWEHTGYEWLPYEKALERITYKNSKEILKKAEELLNR